MTQGERVLAAGTRGPALTFDPSPLVTPAHAPVSASDPGDRVRA
jgi:hypothetical protein